MRLLRLLATSVVVSFLLAGCGGKKAAQQWAMTATNTLGTLECQTPKKLKDVVEAFDEVLKDMEFQKASAEVKFVEAVIEYRGAGDTTVTVKLKEFPTYTNIKVRCGLLGDDALSRHILEKVYSEL